MPRDGRGLEQKGPVRRRGEAQTEAPPPGPAARPRRPAWAPARSPDLVKVSDDLVQEAQALHPHVVAIQLDVEVIEVGDGGKHDAHLRVRLVVEVLGVKGWVTRQGSSGEPEPTARCTCGVRRGSGDGPPAPGPADGRGPGRDCRPAVSAPGLVPSGHAERPELPSLRVGVRRPCSAGPGPDWAAWPRAPEHARWHPPCQCGHRPSSWGQRTLHPLMRARGGQYFWAACLSQELPDSPGPLCPWGWQREPLDLGSRGLGNSHAL